MDLAADPVPQGVVDGQHQRGVGWDQGGADQVQQDQAELVGRPAGGGEEAVGQVVVAPPGKPGTDQHAGDRVQARLGQEPGDHGTEGRKRRRGEAGTEHDEQVGERAR